MKIAKRANVYLVGDIYKSSPGQSEMLLNRFSEIFRCIGNNTNLRAFNAMQCRLPSAEVFLAARFIKRELAATSAIG